MIEKSPYPQPTSLNRFKVFVGGLPENWDDVQASRFMQQFGNIVAVQIRRNEEGNSKRFGFVTLDSHLDPQEIYGKHYFQECAIEIKELKQRFVYLAVPSHSSFSQESIYEAFLKRGYQIEGVEFDNSKMHRSAFFFHKVNFYSDNGVKEILNGRYVEIGGVPIECLSSISKPSYRNGNYPSSAQGMPKSNKQKQNYQTRTNGPPGKTKAQYYQAYDYMQEGPQQDYNLSETQDETFTEQSHQVLAAARPHQREHKTHVMPVDTPTKATPNQKESSDEASAKEQQSSSSKQVSQQQRKLSYNKAKVLEFYPTHGSESSHIAAAAPLGDHQASFYHQMPMITPLTASTESPRTKARLSNNSANWNGQPIMMYPNSLLVSPPHTPDAYFSHLASFNSVMGPLPTHHSHVPLSMVPAAGMGFMEPTRRKEWIIGYYTFPDRE